MRYCSNVHVIVSGCLDERTTALGLSVMFHQKAEQYVDNVPKWSVTIDGIANADKAVGCNTKEASIMGSVTDIPSLGKEL